MLGTLAQIARAAVWVLSEGGGREEHGTRLHVLTSQLDVQLQTQHQLLDSGLPCQQLGTNLAPDELMRSGGLSAGSRAAALRCPGRPAAGAAAATTASRRAAAAAAISSSAGASGAGRGSARGALNYRPIFGSLSS